MTLAPEGSHISLFSGVGCTDIAMEAAGFKTIATAEVDPFCRSVLEARFPDAWHFSDVRQVRPEHFKGPLEVARPLLVSGGFPCQDISSAGTGQGLSGTRSGLWGEFARVIRDLRPEYVLIENSPLLRTRGLDAVLNDLAIMGYAANWDCVPAAAAGAPHMRDRMFVCAWRTNIRAHAMTTPHLTRAGKMRSGRIEAATPAFLIRDVRREAVRWWGSLYPTPTKSDGSGGPGTTPKRTGGKNLRTVVAELEGNGRLNPVWVEWLMGLPSGWTHPDVQFPLPHEGWDLQHVEYLVTRTVPNGEPLRGKRIRALGNGMVPQAAAMALDNLMEWRHA